MWELLISLKTIARAVLAKHPSATQAIGHAFVYVQEES
jgi:hypothetical protein